MKRTDQAAQQFGDGFNCAQAVLLAFAADAGLEPALAAKLTCGFGGGLGRTAGTCGAVTGAALVLGLKYGATSGQDREAKEQTYQRIRDFVARFMARHGSIVCRDLLGVDISTPAGFEESKRRGLHTAVCAQLVRDAVELLEERT